MKQDKSKSYTLEYEECTFSVPDSARVGDTIYGDGYTLKITSEAALQAIFDGKKPTGVKPQPE